MGASSSRDTFPKNISKLLAEDIDPADQNFWDNLWKTNLSINVCPSCCIINNKWKHFQEICQYITPDTVRKLIVDKPLNFQIIFTQAVGQLYQVCSFFVIFLYLKISDRWNTVSNIFWTSFELCTNSFKAASIYFGDWL